MAGHASVTLSVCPGPLSPSTELQHIRKRYRSTAPPRPQESTWRLQWIMTESLGSSPYGDRCWYCAEHWQGYHKATNERAVWQHGKRTAP